MSVIAGEHVGTVREALMASLSKASRDGERDSGWAYQHALETIGYVGTRPVTIDVGEHAWALLYSLERRAGLEREAIDMAASESQRRAAWSRMTAAELAIEQLRLDAIPEPARPRPATDSRHERR